MTAEQLDQLYERLRKSAEEMAYLKSKLGTAAAYLDAFPKHYEQTRDAVEMGIQLENRKKFLALIAKFNQEVRWLISTK
jgi:hypothetical protein